MMIKENFHLRYDLSGNMVLTIPKSYLRNIEQNILLKSIERLIKAETEKMTISEDWDGDSASDVVGICKSDVNDGSVQHDKYIYGVEP